MWGGLTTTPKFWHDEAVPFEIARNLAEFGRFDLAIAPGVFWEKSFMTHATGFPLTAPLAGIFKIFGVGVAQSRIFMVAWMLATLATLFLVMRAFFDEKTAFFSVLLIATFSSFYANGRTGTGEIPGFFFLLIALYFLYKKEWYGLGGLFAALAAVTKPSMYLLVLPVVIIELIARNSANVFTGLRAGAGTVSSPPAADETSEGEPSSALAGRARKVKTFALFLGGTAPIMFFWLYLINPAPFSLVSWQGMIAFYRDAFNAPSLLSQFPQIIPDLLTHSTIIYFILLFIPLFIAWRKNLFSPTQNRLVIFLFLYGIASIFYFLRSPGWFRYLLGTELLILMLSPAALERTVANIFPFLAAPSERGSGFRASLSRSLALARTMPAPRSKPGKMLATILLVIAAFQSAQYLWNAEIPSGAKSIETARVINNLLAADPAATVGIVDNSPVAALIPADRKYQRTLVGNNAPVGAHPLELPPDKLPTYLFNIKKDDPYRDRLESFYEPLPEHSAIYRSIRLK